MFGREKSNNSMASKKRRGREEIDDNQQTLTQQWSRKKNCSWSSSSDKAVDKDDSADQTVECGADKRQSTFADSSQSNAVENNLPEVSGDYDQDVDWEAVDMHTIDQKVKEFERRRSSLGAVAAAPQVSSEENSARQESTPSSQRFSQVADEQLVEAAEQVEKEVSNGATEAEESSFWRFLEDGFRQFCAEASSDDDDEESGSENDSGNKEDLVVDSDDDIYGKSDEGMDLTEKEAKKIARQFTQTFDNQEEICESTEQNEIAQSQRYLASQSQLTQESEIPLVPFPPRQSITAAQSTLTQYFRTAQPDEAHHSLPQSTERCVYRQCQSDFTTKIFKAGETFPIKAILKSKYDALKKYVIVAEKFVREEGAKWAAQYDRDSGLYVNLARIMILGEAKCQELAESELWKSIPEHDRYMARHVKGPGPPPTKASSKSRLTLDAISVRLLDCPPKPIPRPNPPLFYQGLGKSHSRHIHEAISFVHPDSFRRTSDSNRDPITLELFAGGGIFASGLKKAAMNVKYAVEMDPMAAATYKANFPGTRVFSECVNHFLENVLNGVVGYPVKGDVEHIHSSSPCKTYSLKNRGPGNTEKDK